MSEAENRKLREFVEYIARPPFGVSIDDLAARAQKCLTELEK